MTCEAGTYNLQTGKGPFVRDPNCNGTHCELYHQDVVATLQVSVRPQASCVPLRLRTAAARPGVGQQSSYVPLQPHR